MELTSVSKLTIWGGFTHSKKKLHKNNKLI